MSSRKRQHGPPPPLKPKPQTILCRAVAKPVGDKKCVAAMYNAGQSEQGRRLLLTKSWSWSDGGKMAAAESDSATFCKSCNNLTFAGGKSAGKGTRPKIAPKPKIACTGTAQSWPLEHVEMESSFDTVASSAHSSREQMYESIDNKTTTCFDAPPHVPARTTSEYAFHNQTTKNSQSANLIHKIDPSPQSSIDVRAYEQIGSPNDLAPSSARSLDKINLSLAAAKQDSSDEFRFRNNIEVDLRENNNRIKLKLFRSLKGEMEITVETGRDSSLSRSLQDDAETSSASKTTTSTSNAGSSSLFDDVISSLPHLNLNSAAPLPDLLKDQMMSEAVMNCMGEDQLDLTDFECTSEQEYFERRHDPTYSSRFARSEPLYQHYGGDSRRLVPAVQRHQTVGEADLATPAGRQKLLNGSQLGSQRTLWCELPEVLQTGVLQRLTEAERKIQEANFEVLTSEASYLRSLNILINHFVASQQLSGNSSCGSVITKNERKRLFGNILAVRDTSEQLLSKMESQLEQNVILTNVCTFLTDHLIQNKELYIKYCSNQFYQDQTLNSLKQKKSDFVRIIKDLESSDKCESLDIRSFLMLPMQRITRYPLLIGAILSRCREDAKQSCRLAFEVATQVVQRCNEGAKQFERIEQLVGIDARLVYEDGGPRKFPLVTQNRWLVKKGCLAEMEFKRKASVSSIRGWKTQSRKIKLFLFTDVLLIVKPSSSTPEEDIEKPRLTVQDYCPRQFLVAETLSKETLGFLPQAVLASYTSNRVFSLTLMVNHKNRQREFILMADSENDRHDWLKYLQNSSTVNSEEKIYEIWDCPRFVAIHEHKAEKHSGLSLQKGGLVDVLKKTKKGDFFGKKVDSDQSGWFPEGCVQEVMSDHIRANNYKQRYKLMHEASKHWCSTLRATRSTTGIKALFRF